jgi:hypothetical protein
MTREEYIGLRQQNNAVILMEYYLEKCKEKDVKPLVLNIQELFTFLNIWLVQQGNSVNDFFNKALDYYDNKFTLTRLYNQKQELIAIQ